MTATLLQHGLAPEEDETLLRRRPELQQPPVHRRSSGARNSDDEHEPGRDGEERRGRPERIRGTDDGDQQAADARADEIRNAPDRLVHPVRALELKPGSAGRLGEHRLASRDPGRIEERPDHGQNGQESEAQPDERAEDRDRGDAHERENVAHDRDAATAEDVDERPREERREQQWNERDRADRRCVGRAPGQLEHEPRERHHRDAVRRPAQSRRRLERDERSQVPAARVHLSLRSDVAEPASAATRPQLLRTAASRRRSEPRSGTRA